MKHNIINGKWSPPNGTFVRVPNEQIPEVIQMLRDNGFPVWNEEELTRDGDEDAIWLNRDGEWNSCCYYVITRKQVVDNGVAELSFPDFKALVTGKLPESWCIQCTEENMKHEAWGRFIELQSCEVGLFYGYINHEEGDLLYMTVSGKPFGEVLQLPTWAALNDLMPEKCKGCNGAGELSKPPFDDSEGCPFCNGSGLEEDRLIFTDEQLINELKSRGYTISKTY